MQASNIHHPAPLALTRFVLLTCTQRLVIGLVVGVIISLFQAVTQIQEQTLTFIPKIAAMVVALVVLMPWMGQHLIEYAAVMFRLQQ